MIIVSLLLVVSILPSCLSWMIIRPIVNNVSTSTSNNHKRKSLSLMMINDNDKSNNKVPSVFPFSMRVALVEKAKKLDENLANGENMGSYSSVGWSNRLGTVLTPTSIPGVYTGDRPFYWNKIDVGCRMTVIQLPSQDKETKNSYDLWVHSPVELDAKLRKALDQLGTVKYIVSPNYEHLKFAPQWAEAYPEANLWGCPGLMERLPQLNFAGEIPYGYRPASWWTNKKQQEQPQYNIQPMENCWDFNEIQPLHINCEVNPFTGKAFFNEVVFYHTLSKSFIATDLYWNYPQKDGIPNSHLAKKQKLSTSADESSSSSPPSTVISSWELAPPVKSIPLGTQFWKFGMDRVYHPFYNKFMIQSKSDYDDIVDFILQDWGKQKEISTIIPAHGDIIRGTTLCQTILEKHLRF